jgi:D-xylose 1-dehydrogenase (NADP+, D-xylono-1,5-lactone-forming)
MSGAASLSCASASSVAPTSRASSHATWRRAAWCVSEAVASRDAAKAAAFAAEFGITRTHGSYDALLSDDALDAVYIPLPNSLHAEWAVRAAQQGRHVLCEKPLAMNVTEARAMFDTARQRGVMLLEAYPWWFQPQTAALLGLLQSGAIGKVRLVQSTFGFSLRDPAGTNIRSLAALGGGALLDAGSYCLSMIRLVMGRAPQRVHASARSLVTVEVHA